MGKKKGGNSTGKVSQGIHSNVRQSLLNANRKEYRASGQRLLNQRRAFEKGKRVMVTIPNPNPHETSRPFIRVTAIEAGWRSNKSQHS